jgi:hypothetical protein
MNGSGKTTWLALAALGAATLGGPALAADKAKFDVAATAKAIDQALQQRLDAEKVKPSPLADDAEFLRRAYLDIAGVIPPADKAAAFLDSKDPDKRAKLIDELLESKQYGRHMADIWQGMLLPRNSDNRRLQNEPMVKWLEENFNNNTPWDKFAHDLLTAEGPQDKNGAVSFFLANPTADKVNDTVAKLFLGIQLQCAQCHNHPFTGWKQTEYWGMAMFFTKVRPDNVNRAARNGNTPGVSEAAGGRAQRLPESAKAVPPKFLHGDEPKLKASEPYRPAVAKWLTAPENPYFAKAAVNRVWHHFFGRGFVNPVDDMHDGNPASHPELLKELADRFTAGGYDVKDLIRAVCHTQAYQRTSKPFAGNDDDTTLFSHMAVKVMAPEQLYDSLEQVLGRNYTRPTGPAGRAAPNGRAQFVSFFLADENADPTEYQAGIPQALRLMNAPQMNNGNAALLTQAVKPTSPPAEVLEKLYLATLSRRPTADEVARLSAYVAKTSGDAKKAYGNVLWALVNSGEFTLNH